MSTTRPPLPAVLLGLDGTLLDTRALWHAAYLQLADELGVEAPADLWERVAGRSMRASLEVYGPAAEREDPDRLVARLVTLAAEVITQPDGAGGRTRQGTSGWSWLPGARELLLTLRADHAERPDVALVTSAWREFTVPLLAEALEGEDVVADTFDAIVCGDDVQEGKPAPESHLRAAALLDVAPEQCLVVEDSPTGVTASESAGMVTLVVPHGGPVAQGPGREVRTDLRGITLADLGELHARLRSERAG